MDSSNNLAIGTSTPQSDTKLLIVGTSTTGGYFAIKVLDMNRGPLFIVRSDGSVSIGSPYVQSNQSSATTTVSGVGAAPSNGALFVNGPIFTTLDLKANGLSIGTTTPQSGGNAYIGGNLTVEGTLTGTITGSASAGNVSAGAFGSNTGNGNYSFPASLSVGTSTAPTGGIATFNGSVGIGTTSPGYKLDVNGTLRATATSTFSSLEIAGGTGNENIRISSNDGADTRYLSGASFDYPTLSYHAWIDNWLRLATGEISFLDRPGTYGGYVNSVRTSDILFKTAHNWNGSAYGQYLDTTMVIRADQGGGSVGIGTTTPTSKLAVSYSDSATTVGLTSANSLVVKNTDATVGNLSTIVMMSENNINNAHSAQLYAVSSGLGFGVGYSEKMRIDSAGNVGIGTASPASLFSVGSASQFQVNTLGSVVAGTWNAGSVDTNLAYGIHALGNDTKSGATYTGAARWAFDMQGYGALFIVSGTTWDPYSTFTGLAMASYTSDVITIISSTPSGALANISSYSSYTTGVWKSANSPTINVRNAANSAEVTVTILGSTPTNATRVYY